MPSAEDVFSETFGRFMKNWGFISSLRQFTDVAFPIASEALAAFMATLLNRSLPIRNTRRSLSSWTEAKERGTKKSRRSFKPG
jgi:hypothetical protein